MAKKDLNLLNKSLIESIISVKENIGYSDLKPNVKGRAGGQVGGVARAKKLTKQQRIRIAKKAAQTRWSN
jgi:hypothetical protein